MLGAIHFSIIYRPIDPKCAPPKHGVQRLKKGEIYSSIVRMTTTLRWNSHERDGQHRQRATNKGDTTKTPWAWRGAPGQAGGRGGRRKRLRSVMAPPSRSAKSPARTPANTHSSTEATGLWGQCLRTKKQKHNDHGECFSHNLSGSAGPCGSECLLWWIPPRAEPPATCQVSLLAPPVAHRSACDPCECLQPVMRGGLALPGKEINEGRMREREMVTCKCWCTNVLMWCGSNTSNTML